MEQVEYPPMSGTNTICVTTALLETGVLPMREPITELTLEGVLGTVFTGTLIEETTIGPYRAVVPQLAGTAWITGFARYVLDPSDPFPEGFTVGDIW